MTTNSSGDLSSVLSGGLSHQCERVRRRIHLLIEPLSHDELWRKPYPYGNSVGHLLLHLTGNLNHYIGAEIAGSGYARDRPKEFTDDSMRAKWDVLQAFDQAVDGVLASLADQAEADWTAPYTAVGADDVKDRLTIFVRCAAHLDHHMGQMIYLCKELSRTAI
jgi:uncharacterized damage-inducible protein DinB